MDLSQYVDALRAHLQATAAAGTEQTQATAGLLADTLEPAVRLAVTDALAAMAAEVTAELDDTAVDVVVRGRDPEVVVTRSAAHAAAPAEPTAPPDDDEAVARISLRLPESLKARADAAAAAAGVSLNTWLVRAVATGLQAPPPTAPRSGPGRRMTGWARS
ncbi:toxin-antitoxin system HicB family antitoxin [Klenkia sp. PcliD-1-E]|uniref:toxin-antitoxin system HicB family antitoxin n=1 Tax=Klenkia sp. PcliD-1-E TaxID=2954492 RepID=UPI002097B58E|nr:toxin-antitoxin system HicB family antitoxin [Klenkia sp. PcliD-1-E]MCO7219273.1 toxin-antitoxin system HicB family antitoxin [Klenkia sp. PcliD-1-E]